MNKGGIEGVSEGVSEGVRGVMALTAGGPSGVGKPVLIRTRVKK